MATSISVPVEEYLNTSYEPDREYIDGELLERHVGEYLHSRLQLLIAALLLGRERDGRFRVFTELRIEVRQRRRYRIPDVCVKALPHAVTPVLTQPDLAIEILSREDEPGDMLQRIGDYLQSGTPVIWVVDPYKRQLFVADHAGVREIPDLVVSTDLVGTVDFNQLFRQLDEPAD
jgi:Uma2 family endonuclease